VRHLLIVQTLVVETHATETIHHRLFALTAQRARRTGLTSGAVNVALVRHVFAAGLTSRCVRPARNRVPGSDRLLHIIVDGEVVVVRVVVLDIAINLLLEIAPAYLRAAKGTRQTLICKSQYTSGIVDSQIVAQGRLPVISTDSRDNGAFGYHHVVIVWRETHLFFFEVRWVFFVA